MKSNELARQRSVLLSVRTRFSPEVQPIKEAAIDKIIEQNLLILDSAEGIISQEIIKKGSLCFAEGLPTIDIRDVEDALVRLVSSGRAILKVAQERNKYRLSKKAKQELREVQSSAEKRLSKVVNQLFKATEENPSEYEIPFLECLCHVFSQLGEIQVQLLQGKVGVDELEKKQILQNSLREVAGKYTNINNTKLEKGVYNFFRDFDPDYVQIKWNMAQNFYVAKALGLDQSGVILSKSFYEEAEFFLDTNIIIPALESVARHHLSFKVLSEACNKLQIGLNVCQISLDELGRVVQSRKEIITKVSGQIPKETAPKVRGVFFQRYYEELESKGIVDIDKLFAAFDHAKDELRKDYGVKLVDDAWFIEEETKKETKELIKKIKIEYLKKRHRNKNDNAALHDALLIRWIFEEREKYGKKSWLITLDSSLPGCVFINRIKNGSPFVVSLDAVLQWIFPVAIYGESEDKVAEIFSDVVTNQLLPQDKIFTMQDFLVFAELEMSCKELPAEDVENCIQHLQRVAPFLDPSKPEHREKLAHNVSRFFVDPSRKFKVELQRLETEKEQLKAGISKLKKETREREKKEKESKLKRSAIWRFVWALALFLGIEVFVLYLANKYGDGANFFQRIEDLWIFSVIVVVIILPILLWFIVGKERLAVLKLPFLKKILSD